MPVGSKPILYLDTNHVSALVRNPSDPAVMALLERIRRRDVSLGVSVHHAIELSDPTFRHRTQVGKLLDRTDLVWAKPLPHLFTAEIEAALALALTGERSDVRVFYPRLGDAWGMPQDVVPEPSGVLEAFATNPDLRGGQAQQAAQSAKLDSLKRAAAVYRDPLEPLRGMINDRDIRRTPNGIVLPSEYPAAEIIAGAGGLSGFPAYEVYNVMLRHRFGDTKFPATGNDMVDEWHAAHAPYVDIIALDRRTAARLQGTRLPAASNAVSKLEELVARLN